MQCATHSSHALASCGKLATPQVLHLCVQLPPVLKANMTAGQCSENHTFAQDVTQELSGMAALCSDAVADGLRGIKSTSTVDIKEGFAMQRNILHMVLKLHHRITTGLVTTNGPALGKALGQPAFEVVMAGFEAAMGLQEAVLCPEALTSGLGETPSLACLHCGFCSLVADAPAHPCASLSAPPFADWWCCPFDLVFGLMIKLCEHGHISMAACANPVLPASDVAPGSWNVNLYRWTECS